jgi:radical SAM protein with 4Fe4S-binding SPASM domain
MKAKIGHRYYSERTKLEEVIPLDTPISLWVDPSSVCDIQCPWCFQHKNHKQKWRPERKSGILPYELFTKIIDDALAFPGRIKLLQLYKEGEPLLNKRLPDMIAYARKKNIANNIDFTTNGLRLNPDLNLALADSGVHRINISIPGLDSESYKKNTGADMDYGKFVKNIEHLYTHKGNAHICVKVVNAALDNRSVDEFYGIFGDICDEIGVENIIPSWPKLDYKSLERDISRPIHEMTLPPNPCEVCTFIFYGICINSDGSIGPCFKDWNRELIFGNANKDSIVDIWNCPELNEMRIKHLRMERSAYGICAACGQIKFGQIDNIDNYANDLLKRMSQK